MSTPPGSDSDTIDAPVSAVAQGKRPASQSSPPEQRDARRQSPRRSSTFTAVDLRSVDDVGDKDEEELEEQGEHRTTTLPNLSSSRNPSHRSRSILDSPPRLSGRAADVIRLPASPTRSLLNSPATLLGPQLSADTTGIFSSGRGNQSGSGNGSGSGSERRRGQRLRLEARGNAAFKLRTKVCKFDVAGSCPTGDECPYLHQTGVRPPPTLTLPSSCSSSNSSSPSSSTNPATDSPLSHSSPETETAPSSDVDTPADSSAVTPATPLRVGTSEDESNALEEKQVGMVVESVGDETRVTSDVRSSSSSDVEGSGEPAGGATSVAEATNDSIVGEDSLEEVPLNPGSSGVTEGGKEDAEFGEIGGDNSFGSSDLSSAGSEVLDENGDIFVDSKGKYRLPPYLTFATPSSVTSSVPPSTHTTSYEDEDPPLSSGDNSLDSLEVGDKEVDDLVEGKFKQFDWEDNKVGI